MRKNLCANCKCAALEREVGRSVLRECRSRPSGGGFQGIRLYRPDAGGRSAKCGWSDRVASPTKRSLGTVASLQSPCRCTRQVIVPLIVKGGVIFEQFAGVG